VKPSLAPLPAQLGTGGPEGTRTPDLADANRALSQLSYRPGRAKLYHVVEDAVQGRIRR
jgi:hypothetical protein